MRVTRVTSRSGGSIIKKLGFDAENVLLVRFYTWLVYNVVSFLHVACAEWIGSLRDRRLTSRRRCRAIRHSLFKSFPLRISTIMRNLEQHIRCRIKQPRTRTGAPAQVTAEGK